MKHQPGDIIKVGPHAHVIYSPSMGSSFNYRIECEHGEQVRARTQRDAREQVFRPDEFCVECRVEFGVTPKMDWRKGPVDSGRHYLVGTDLGVFKGTDDRWTNHNGETEGYGVEWIVVGGVTSDNDDGENLAFFDTMREAKVDAERRATTHKESN